MRWDHDTYDLHPPMMICLCSANALLQGGNVQLLLTRQSDARNRDGAKKTPADFFVYKKRKMSIDRKDL